MKSIIMGASLVAAALGADCNGMFFGAYANYATDVCFEVAGYSQMYSCTTETLDTFQTTDCSGTAVAQTPFAGFTAFGATYECTATDCDYFMMTTYPNTSATTCGNDSYTETPILLDICSGNATATCCSDSPDVCYQQHMEATCSSPFLEFSLSLVIGDICTTYDVPSGCNATAPMYTTDMWSNDSDAGCNGVSADLDGIQLNAPSDVCFVTASTAGTYSSKYYCNGTMDTFFSGDCTAPKVATSPVNGTSTCDSYDCDYGMLTLYANNSDGSCDSSQYQEIPLTMSCHKIDLGLLGVVNMELYCADNSSGGDVSADVWFGDTDCSGSPTVSYDDAVDAFANFGLDASCAAMVCYEAGFVSFAPTPVTTAPTAMPTMAPVPTADPTTAIPTADTTAPSVYPTMSPLVSTETPTTDGCNGVNAEILGVELSGPTDVCINSQADAGDYSIMYSCDSGKLHTYSALDCAGSYTTTELEDGSTMTCDASDCDYGVITQYANSTTSSDGCDADVFEAFPFSTDCYYLITSVGGVSVDLFCQDDSTNGGAVSANIWFGDTGCTGAGSLSYDDALDAFAFFGADATCMDMTCYQAGYHSVDVTLNPTMSPIPTADPTTGAPTTGSPTMEPTQSPSNMPTAETSAPSGSPTMEPTMSTAGPTESPTNMPTDEPTEVNTSAGSMVTAGMAGVLIVAGLLRMN